LASFPIILEIDPDDPNMLPIVKLLAVPAAVLKRRAFRISIFAVPALIELKAPAAVKTTPIEALLIVPANNVPIVKVLAEPEAVLKRRVFKISVFIVLAVKFAVLSKVVLKTGGIKEIPPLAPTIPVSKDPSPEKRPNTFPAEIVEKKPKLVDITPTEILRAVKSPVLSKVVLKTGGTKDIPPLPPTIPVSKDPSPTKRPNTVPAEIVEKKPKEVDIITAEILDTARR
jgi:hypothetical protein